MTVEKAKLIAGYVKMALAVMFAVAFLYMAIRSNEPFGLHDLLAIMGMLGFAASGGESALHGEALRLKRYDEPPF